MTSVNGVRVGVLDFEGRDGRADAVEALLDVCSLGVGLADDFRVSSGCSSREA